MQHSPQVEQLVLEQLRLLPLEQQQQVLAFAQSLRQQSDTASTSLPSLQAIAALPVAERHQILASSIALTATDFVNDPTLTEFSSLDTADWPEDD